MLTSFLHYKSMGVFFKRSRKANSAVRGRILPNFELLRDIIIIMVVLHTCKNEEDPIKNEDARDYMSFFSDTQGQLTPKSAMEFCRNSNSSKLL